ncbi:MAG TPA: hypothetical protein PKY82_19575 [Pyrinomonadaceae bacterium]|nr:hypothetical protein [Pyrinomonadaceae bacterium]
MENETNQTTEEPNNLESIDQQKEPHVTLISIPETNEYEIQIKETADTPAQTVRIPKDEKDLYQLMPDEFVEAQNAIEEFNFEKRKIEVYSDSLESYIGYDALLRVLGKYYCRQVAYYTSEEGGSLSVEEARAAAYREKLTDEEAIKLFESLMRRSTETINFLQLLELHRNSPRMAQNVWEMIKREAAREFESGHRAAAVFEPADYMTDAWNRASYLGLRESLIEEWKPKGGMELTMIDAIAQAWLMLQHWTEENVRRAKTEPRRENHEFYKWKQWNKEANPKQWGEGHWDVPTIGERNAVEHAAQMADRWQRMYFRAIRSLRDWRRYSQQVTINNPQQVNIGDKQINVAPTSETDKPNTEK